MSGIITRESLHWRRILAGGESLEEQVSSPLTRKKVTPPDMSNMTVISKQYLLKNNCDSRLDSDSFRKIGKWEHTLFILKM